MKTPLLWTTLALACLGAERMTVQDALAATERLNPELQEARLRILESEWRTQATRSAYLPQANLEVGTTYETSNLQGIGVIFPGFPSRVGPYRTFNARPVVRQTVLDLSLLDSIRASRVRAQQSKIAAESVREDLQIAMVQLYLQALQASSRQDAASERLKTAEAIWKQWRDREEAGTGSKLDVTRAEQQVEAERGALIVARREASVMKSLLLRAIGREQSPDIELVAPEMEEKASAVSAEPAKETAFEARKDLLALETGLSAAKLDIRSAERQRLPAVSALADWGVLGAGPDRSIGTYRIGASMRIPLWTGRRIESEVAIAKLQAQQLEKQIGLRKVQIDQELRQAAIEGEEARRAFESAERGRQAARETLELSRLRVGAGLATAVDVAVAQSALSEADDRMIRARYDGYLASAKMAWAMGDVRKAFP